MEGRFKFDELNHVLKEGGFSRTWWAGDKEMGEVMERFADVLEDLVLEE